AETLHFATSGEPTRAFEPAVAASDPVLIPVRPAVSIGGLLLLLVAPLVRSRRFRRRLI
ncbi:MAG: hypothetical protein JWO31_2400, partial [Phycisphaerales bacterium]|nr:hypothetical protein [Phycisphaerales bacterium]